MKPYPQHTLDQDGHISDALTYAGRAIENIGGCLAYTRGHRDPLISNAIRNLELALEVLGWEFQGGVVQSAESSVSKTD